MIAYLKGVLAEAGPDSAIIEVNGVGYYLAMPALDLQGLPPAGQVVRVHTRLVWRETGGQLFGFLKPASVEAFDLLLEVSGVGPKVALGILSVLRLRELREACLTGNAALLSRAQGVGKKTAQRIIMELKDKFGALPGDGPEDGSLFATATEGGAVGDALSALTALGYNQAEAGHFVAAAVRELGGDGTVEEILRTALRLMAAGSR
ncbi:MAG TPA: Holliday junction branch migration protein RuvA [Spirochaetia bacterium]|nr:Holliday junction branch migration protein RuvA [Spirochaetia bacterium]